MVNQKRTRAAVALSAAAVALSGSTVCGFAALSGSATAVLRSSPALRSCRRPNIRARTALRVLSEAAPPATVDAPAAAQPFSPSDVELELQARSSTAAAVARPLRAAKAANLVIESDTLVDEPYMIAIVGATVTFAAVMMAGAVASMVASASPVASVAASTAAFAAGVLFADAFTGVFHWSVDNYGGLSTPVFGTVIEAFQGHHGSPWTITYRNFANNVHKICYGVLPLLGLLALAHPGPAAVTFGVTSLMGLMMCQELHKYSHMVRPPGWIAKLQSSGIILSKKDHGLHHSSPFEEKYCIVTGHCNGIMDSSGLFRRLEKFIYLKTGVEPNCWKLDETGRVKAAAMKY